jgi:putative nucleotidyltransferase with HDIG domain
VDDALRRLAAHDADTAVHAERVAGIAEAIARVLGLPEDAVATVVTAAELHDIGKITVPRSILLGSGELDDEAWALIRTHAETGACAAEQLGCGPEIVDAIRFHHENVDGSGYPNGLRGGEIPLCARIVRVADTLDAMTSGRSYQRPLSLQSALARLRGLSGEWFCPHVVDTLARIDWSAAPARGYEARTAA